MPRGPEANKARIVRSGTAKLRQANARLKKIVTQLSVIALKNATTAFDETLPLAKYAPTNPDLLEIADECSRLMREVLGVANRLEQIVNALIDKAVALEINSPAREIGKKVELAARIFLSQRPVKQAIIDAESVLD
jgi:hypothetical protein